jgi:anti-sigma factor RsiW
LEPDQAAAVEEHLHECPDCRKECDWRQSLAASLRDPSLRFSPPSNLVERLRGRLDAESKPIRVNGNSRAWMVAASLLLCLGVGASAALFTSFSDRADYLTRDLVAAHARSLLADHLLDVPSSNRHTVKPWFEGRTDFAPTVKDLKGGKFELVGGRLDFVGDRTAAAIVYRCRLHSVNLFLWPTSEPDSAAATATRRGYHLIWWIKDGMHYAAVSDLNAEELGEFARTWLDSPP